MSIHVTGDQVTHWLLQLGTGDDELAASTGARWGRANFVRVQSRRWGASLIKELLLAAKAASSGPFEVTGPKLDPENADLALQDPEFRKVARDFALWREDEHGVWRMRRFLLRADASKTQEPEDPVQEPLTCLVIDDIRGGFRNHQAWWPNWLLGTDVAPKHIILKLVAPVPRKPVTAQNAPSAAGPPRGTTDVNYLWDHLIARFSEQLTVYCKVGALRAAELAPIGQSLSWERLANDVLKAVEASGLTQAKRIVVSLGLSGAAVFEREDDSVLQGILVFDPRNQEGDWERAISGQPVGSGRYLVAAMAVEAAIHPAAPDWIAGVKRGLAAGRVIHEEGFGSSRAVRLRFVHPGAVRWVAGPDPSTSSPFERVDIEREKPGGRPWRLLKVTAAGSSDDAMTLAREGRIKGATFPTEVMGQWNSVDRDEIESMRSVRNLVREYLAQEARSGQPLNLAVFGPPGAGKSFAVNQMVEHINKQEPVPGVTLNFKPFNLAQLGAIDALPAALHNVRDDVVRGKTPVVFWDEFDATVDGQPLGWLAPFLAPMQDGKFADGDAMRPIGPAVFIFAGGVFRTMDQFRHRARELSAREQAELGGGRGKPTKAIDFVSRIRGYVDILGPNPTHGEEVVVDFSLRPTLESFDANEIGAPKDQAFLLRRALLLRGLLIKNAPWLFAVEQSEKTTLNIDGGVLRAFLNVPSYQHGARSMEAIIQMSALAGRSAFERSALPPRHQLDLHVRADEFLALVQAPGAEVTAF